MSGRLRGANNVSPNPALPTRVVASAWRNRQQCPTVEEGALGRFITAHAGKSLGSGSGNG